MTDDKDRAMGAGNCDEALERLYEYLDNEMEAATAEGIRSHLDECGSCHGRFDFEWRLKLVVRERLAEEVPERFLIKLRDALEREAAQP